MIHKIDTISKKQVTLLKNVILSKEIVITYCYAKFKSCAGHSHYSACCHKFL